jgi:hypothetical protein
MENWERTPLPEAFSPPPPEKCRPVSEHFTGIGRQIAHTPWHLTTNVASTPTCDDTCKMDYGEWRAVPGIDASVLLVSSTGWIRTKYGGGFADANGNRELGPPRQGMAFKGHKVVNIRNKKYKISELVCYAFVGPRPSTNHIVFHKDGDVLNSNVENLRWGTTADSDEYGEWRPVPNIDPNKLQVSSQGWVRVRRKGGKSKTAPLDFPSRGQRLANTMRGVSVDTASYLVHRLVALAFFGSPPTPLHTTVDHIDGDVDNNRIDNLRWATQTEQCANKGVAKPSYLHAGEEEDQGNIVVDGEIERWAQVNDTLRVSTMGRVQRRYPHSTTKWMRKGTPPTNKRKAGYVYVAIGEKRVVLHRVIILTFLGPSDDPLKCSVDHINNIRNDNRLCNLRWATNQEQGKNTVRGKRKRNTFQDL